MKSLLVAFVFIAFVSEAQITRYSFRAAANYPIIPTVSNLSEVTPHGFSIHQGDPPGGNSYVTSVSLEDSFDEKAGFDAGGNVDVALNAKFFLTVGLQGSYLRFKRTNSAVFDGFVGSTYSSMGDLYLSSWTHFHASTPKEPAPDDGTIPRPSDNVGKTTTVYLQIPILAGYSLMKDKFLVRAGGTVSCLLNATQVESKVIVDDSYPYGYSLKDVKVNTRDGYSKVLASVTVQATYLVTKQIGIDFTVNKFLTPIYSDTNQDKKAKYNVVSLGLSYNVSK